MSSFPDPSGSYKTMGLVNWRSANWTNLKAMFLCLETKYFRTYQTRKACWIMSTKVFSPLTDLQQAGEQTACPSARLKDPILTHLLIPADSCVCQGGSLHLHWKVLNFPSFMFTSSTISVTSAKFQSISLHIFCMGSSCKSQFTKVKKPDWRQWVEKPRDVLS